MAVEYDRDHPYSMLPLSLVVHGRLKPIKMLKLHDFFIFEITIRKIC